VLKVDCPCLLVGRTQRLEHLLGRYDLFDEVVALKRLGRGGNLIRCVSEWSYQCGIPDDGNRVAVIVTSPRKLAGEGLAESTRGQDDTVAEVKSSFRTTALNFRTSVGSLQGERYRRQSPSRKCMCCDRSVMTYESELTLPVAGSIGLSDPNETNISSGANTPSESGTMNAVTLCST
jgi:hypothetical protein